MCPHIPKGDSHHPQGSASCETQTGIRIKAWCLITRWVCPPHILNGTFKLGQGGNVGHPGKKHTDLYFPVSIHDVCTLNWRKIRSIFIVTEALPEGTVPLLAWFQIPDFTAHPGDRQFWIQKCGTTKSHVNYNSERRTRVNHRQTKRERPNLAMCPQRLPLDFIYPCPVPAPLHTVRCIQTIPLK